MPFFQTFSGQHDHAGYGEQGIQRDGRHKEAHIADVESFHKTPESSGGGCRKSEVGFRNRDSSACSDNQPAPIEFTLDPGKEKDTFNQIDELIHQGGQDLHKAYEHSTRDDLGTKHHEHEDIRFGGDINSDNPSTSITSKDPIDASKELQPNADNVLPKDYQNEERMKVQQSIMDQTNNIVGLFQKMQNNPGGGHQKSPEMTFLKRASQMTGTGPWSVTKGKRRDETGSPNSKLADDYKSVISTLSKARRDRIPAGFVSESRRDDIQPGFSNVKLAEDYESTASIPNDYVDMEHEQMNNRLSHENMAVKNLFDSVLSKGKNDGRYAENTFVDRLVKLTNTPWGLSKRQKMFVGSKMTEKMKVAEGRHLGKNRKRSTGLMGRLVKKERRSKRDVESSQEDSAEASSDSNSKGDIESNYQDQQEQTQNEEEPDTDDKSNQTETGNEDSSAADVENNDEDDKDSLSDTLREKMVQQQDKITNELIYGVEHQISKMYQDKDPNKEFKEAQKRFDDVTSKIADTTWGLTGTKKNKILKTKQLTPSGYKRKRSLQEISDPTPVNFLRNLGSSGKELVTARNGKHEGVIESFDDNFDDDVASLKQSSETDERIGTGSAKKEEVEYENDEDDNGSESNEEVEEEEDKDEDDDENTKKRELNATSKSTGEQDETLLTNQAQITSNLIYGVEDRIKAMYADKDPNKEYKEAQKRFDDVTSKIADTTWGLTGTKKSKILKTKQLTPSGYKRKRSLQEISDPTPVNFLGNLGSSGKELVTARNGKHEGVIESFDDNFGDDVASLKQSSETDERIGTGSAKKEEVESENDEDDNGSESNEEAEEEDDDENTKKRKLNTTSKSAGEQDKTLLTNQAQITSNLIYGVEDRIKAMYADKDPNKEYKEAQKRFDDVTSKIADTTWGLTGTKKSKILKTKNLTPSGNVAKRSLHKISDPTPVNLPGNVGSSGKEGNTLSESHANQRAQAGTKGLPDDITARNGKDEEVIESFDANFDDDVASSKQSSETDERIGTGSAKKEEVEYENDEDDNGSESNEEAEEEDDGDEDDDENAKKRKLNTTSKSAEEQDKTLLTNQAQITSNLIYGVEDRIKAMYADKDPNKEYKEAQKRFDDVTSKIADTTWGLTSLEKRSKIATGRRQRHGKQGKKSKASTNTKSKATRSGQRSRNKKGHLHRRKGNHSRKSSRRKSNKSRLNKRHKNKYSYKKKGAKRRNKSKKKLQSFSIKKHGKKSKTRKATGKGTFHKRANKKPHKHKKIDKKKKKKEVERQKMKPKVERFQHKRPITPIKKVKRIMALVPVKRNHTGDDHEDNEYGHEPHGQHEGNYGHEPPEHHHEQHGHHLEHHGHQEEKINFEKLVSTPEDHVGKDSQHPGDANIDHHVLHHAEDDEPHDEHHHHHHHHHHQGRNSDSGGDHYPDHEEERYHGDDREDHYDEPSPNHHHQHHHDSREFDSEDDRQDDRQDYQDRGNYDDGDEGRDGGHHETAEASTVDHMLPKGYVDQEHHRLDDRIHHEENEMKHLFDDVVTHHDYGRNEDRAEDKFVDKLKHLTETTWGLKKKKFIAGGVGHDSKISNSVKLLNETTSRNHEEGLLSLSQKRGNLYSKILPSTSVDHLPLRNQEEKRTASKIKPRHPIKLLKGRRSKESFNSLAEKQTVTMPSHSFHARQIAGKVKLNHDNGEDNTAEKRTRLATRHANKTTTTTTNTFKKQTIDNSLVTNDDEPSKNANNIQQHELKNILNGLSAIQQQKQTASDIHDNSLLGDQPSHGTGEAVQRSQADLSNHDLSLIKSSFQPEELHAEQEENKAMEAQRERLLGNTIVDMQHHSQNRQNNTFGDVGDTLSEGSDEANPNDLTVSEPDESRDIAQFAPASDHSKEENEDGQVYKILHDVKMEGEDPIADDKYYSGKDGGHHSDDHEENQHKTHNVHMRQHEYDVVSDSHDRESNDYHHRQSHEEEDQEHHHENHKGMFVI